MVARQQKRPEFTGGLEAARLTEHHAALLRTVRPRSLFFAYDTPDDLAPLRRAGELLQDVGFSQSSHVLRAYVLCGWGEQASRRIPADTFTEAERRMRQAMTAGFTPMAMLYRDHTGQTSREWRVFQRSWARPAAIHAQRSAK
jgi:hypothetical protein